MGLKDINYSTFKTYKETSTLKQNIEEKKKRDHNKKKKRCTLGVKIL